MTHPADRASKAPRAARVGVTQASTGPYARLAQPAGAAQGAARALQPVVSLKPAHIDSGADAMTPISRFIELEIEARKCPDLHALRYSLVNATRQLAEFDQAFLTEKTATGEWTISAASSVVKVDHQTHLVRSLTKWLQHPEHATLIARAEPRLSNLEMDAKTWGIRAPQFTSPHVLWLPIKSPLGVMLGALIALKTENWRPQHSALMIPLADAYGHAWNALAPREGTLEKARGYVSKARLALACTAIALAATFLPVPMSALAPAEIVAAEPGLVTAPIDGVVEDILVPPGALVAKDTPLVKFVDVKLRNDAELARRNMAVAAARYFKVVQSATVTQKDMQDLATTKAEYDVAEAEVAFAEEQLHRATVRAERSGIVIYASKSDWLGKPVALGERLMEIGDPAKPEIRIDLPLAEAFALRPGARVSLYLDGEPLHAISGTIIRAAYRPSLSAEQQMVYRATATFDDKQQQRIGLRGTVRVSGDSVTLGYYLLRKPLTALRQRVGL